MTPFDVTYADAFLTEQSFAAACPPPAVTPARVDIAPAPAAPPGAALPGFPLADTLALRAALTAEAEQHGQPRSMLTPSYTEFLLQLLDKDSIMTGLAIIALYVGLIQSM
jgi:hypothetical protein